MKFFPFDPISSFLIDEKGHNSDDALFAKQVRIETGAKTGGFFFTSAKTGESEL